eukprot:1195787-Prorocentrum_minimum.AAC.4
MSGEAVTVVTRAPLHLAAIPGWVRRTFASNVETPRANGTVCAESCGVVLSFQLSTCSCSTSNTTIARVCNGPLVTNPLPPAPLSCHIVKSRPTRSVGRCFSVACFGDLRASLLMNGMTRAGRQGALMHALINGGCVAMAGNERSL